MNWFKKLFKRKKSDDNKYVVHKADNIETESHDYVSDESKNKHMYNSDTDGKDKRYREILSKLYVKEDVKENVKENVKEKKSYSKSNNSSSYNNDSKKEVYENNQDDLLHPLNIISPFNPFNPIYHQSDYSSSDDSCNDSSSSNDCGSSDSGCDCD